MYQQTILLRVEEVATELRVARSRVYELLATGAIASVKIGRSRRVPRKALEDYVASLTDGLGAA